MSFSSKSEQNVASCCEHQDGPASLPASWAAAVNLDPLHADARASVPTSPGSLPRPPSASTLHRIAIREPGAPLAGMRTEGPPLAGMRTQEPDVIRLLGMDKTERRAQILAHARDVFAKRGYHAAKIDDIVSAAGVARGTFYLYFEDKRAIFEEIVDRTIA